MITERLSSTMLGALDGTTLSLQTAAPTVAGQAELVGGSYARQLAALAPPLDGVRKNRDLIRFVNLPGATVSHAALWSGASLLWVVPLAAPITLAPGDGLEFFPGDLAFGLKDTA